MKYFIILTLFLVSCRLNETTVYVDKDVPVNTTALYSIRYDKDGKVNGEFKSKEFKEIEANAKAMTQNSHLYSVLKFEVNGIMDTVTTIVEGKIEYTGNVPLFNEIEVELKSDKGLFQPKIDKSRKFKFSHIPHGKYHLFIRTENLASTIIKPLVLKSGHSYTLTINKKE